MLTCNLIPRLLSALVAVYLMACAAAFPPAIARFAGRWELVRSESDNIDKAIETTIAPMSFLARPIARTKLKRRNVAFPQFTIREGEGGVRVTHQQGLDVLYPDVGAAVKTRAPDGTDAITRLTVESELLLSYDADAGRREDRYTLSADGSTLTLSVRLTSGNLPKPLVYKLVYRRQATAAP